MKHEMTGMLASMLLGVLIAILAIVTPAAPHQERLIVCEEAGMCSLTVEADDEARTVRLRVSPNGQGCHIDKVLMLETLQNAFSKNNAPKLEGVYFSLCIGRLVDYPWLSQYLAGSAWKDQAWDREKGKPVNLDLYRYVKNLLARKEVAGEIDKALAAAGYRVASLTVEKILVGGLRDVPFYQGKMAPGKVPFDGIVWFILKKDQGQQ
jgi:hypothetical protein